MKIAQKTFNYLINKENKKINKWIDQITNEF